jgi:microcystin-dependent protein
MVAHNNIPAAGWLKCNGAVLVRSSYQLLFAAIGTLHNTGGETILQFRLPDYRGEFVRGFDDGRGVDTGRQMGSSQDDALQGFAIPAALANGVDGPCADTWTNGAKIATKVLPISDGVNGTPRIAKETRPRNKAVNYWIKY